MMDSSTFFPIISGMVGGAAAAGFFKGPIQTIEDWWFINFGHSANEQANMMRAKQSADIEIYKHDILHEASKIESQNVKEPQMKILGPALEASRFYIEEEPLRIMFAKLIASSIDKSKEDILHSSYVEIIKQLSPLDAENLLSIHESGNAAPTVKLYAYYKANDQKIIKYTNLFLGNHKNQNQKLSGASLSNLARLGLISIDYGESLVPDNIYHNFGNTEEFQNVRLFIENHNAEIRSNKQDNVNLLDGPAYIPGIILITQYGENFCATCL